jgi:hypothetical protein
MKPVPMTAAPMSAIVRIASLHDLDGGQVAEDA